MYRSTLTSTAVVDEFESSIDNSDYSNKIISYTNERLCMYAEPEYTSDVVGVMYSGTEADIVKPGSEWTEVTSGGVTGYIKNTDVLFGKEAQKIAETIGDKEAVAKSDGLVVYSEASASSSQVAELSKGESVGAYEECDGYVMISYEGGYGYVKADGVSISYGLDSAISIEEEKKRQAEEAAAAAKKAAEEAAAKAAAAAKEKYASVSTTARSSYSASADEIHLLAAIVYWESGWEPANGQLAVANVVLNRVLSSRFSQNTIASVIYAPGVGAILAERIVSYREAVGGFQTLEELQQVNGIGSGIYSQIAPYLFIIGELQTISPEPDAEPSESSEPTIPEEETASDSESIPHLDINTATAEDFQKLPNITPEQAEAIVRLRTQIQYFQNIYELLYADGMTDRLFLSIRDYLYVSFA